MKYSVDLVATIKLLTHEENKILEFSGRLEELLNSSIDGCTSIMDDGNILQFSVPKDCIDEETFVSLIDKVLENRDVADYFIVVNFDTKYVWNIE